MADQPGLWDEPDGAGARLVAALDDVADRHAPAHLQTRWPGADLLRDSLAMAVPLWILKVADWPASKRAEAVEVGVDLIASAAEGAVAPAERRRLDVRAATIFNVLARSLALMASSPGGVTFLGDHWCLDHDACIEADPAADGA